MLPTQVAYTEIGSGSGGTEGQLVQSSWDSAALLEARLGLAQKLNVSADELVLTLLGDGTLQVNVTMPPGVGGASLAAAIEELDAAELSEAVGATVSKTATAVGSRTVEETEDRDLVCPVRAAPH